MTTKHPREREAERIQELEQEKQQHIALCNKWAKRYYELGYKPIPIKYKSKTPNIESTTPYFRENITKETFDKWIQEEKYENIAILGGEIACFDFDDPLSFKQLELLTQGLIDKGAWVTETPKEPGRYHVVGTDRAKGITTRKSAEGIELRQWGHYWLVYPSIHPNGKRYNLLNTKNPEELTKPGEINALAVYETYISKLRTIRGTVQKNKEILQNKNSFDNGPDCIRLAWEQGATSGARYYTAGALGSWLQQQKFPLDMALSLIRTWFTEKCSQEGRPLSDIENAAKLGYKGKYQTGCTWWREKTDFCPYPNQKDCSFCKSIGKDKKILLDKYDVFERNEQGIITRINCPRLAKLIFHEEGPYLVMNGSQEVLVYNGKYYEANGEAHIENKVNEYLEDRMCSRYKNEVLNFIKTYRYTKIEDLEPPLNLINLKNGILDINTKELHPHTPEYYFLNQIPVNYNPDAKIDKIQNFFEESLDIPDIPLVQEFLGDILQRSYSYKRAFMCVGERDTGKSQFLNLIDYFIGHDNASNVGLYDLCTDKYSTIELRGKLVNTCSELDPTAITHTQKFLSLTGGDWQSANEKFKPRTKFKSYAKLIFACNQIPDVNNKNEAFYIRWIVLVFSNKIPREDQIEDYYKILCTEDELSGLLNWALEGLQRLRQNHQYSEHRSLEEITALMQQGSNPIREFVDQFIIVDPTAEITKLDLYLSYVDFCKNRKYPFKSDAVFSRQFKPYLPYGCKIDETQPRKKGRKHTWRGINCTYVRIDDMGDDTSLDVFDSCTNNTTDKQQEGKNE